MFRQEEVQDDSLPVAQNLSLLQGAVTPLPGLLFQ